ncbi:MAG: hypothetical protein WC806_06685, partial [Candidatus Gracilibacteria bacterium]
NAFLGNKNGIPTLPSFIGATAMQKAGTPLQQQYQPPVQQQQPIFAQQPIQQQQMFFDEDGDPVEYQDNVYGQQQFAQQRDTINVNGETYVQVADVATSDEANARAVWSGDKKYVPASVIQKLNALHSQGGAQIQQQQPLQQQQFQPVRQQFAQPPVQQPPQNISALLVQIITMLLSALLGGNKQQAQPVQNTPVEAKPVQQSQEVDTNEVEDKEVDTNEVDDKEVDTNEVDDKEVDTKEVDDKEVDKETRHHHKKCSKDDN